MIPIPASFKTRLKNWIPKTLPVTEYPFIETQIGIPRPECPAIIGWFSSQTPSDGAYSLLRTVRNQDGDLDDYWGERLFTTLSISLRAYDPDELGEMHLSFIRQINKKRRDMTLRRHGVEFREILRSESLPMANVPESATGDQVFMAQIDLKIEYEIADVSDADYIKTVSHDVLVSDSTVPLVFESQIYEYSVACGLKALILEAVLP